MHDIVGRAWASALAERVPVACMSLPSECDWTSDQGYHTKSVHVYNTGTVSQA